MGILLHVYASYSRRSLQAPIRVLHDGPALFDGMRLEPFPQACLSYMRMKIYEDVRASRSVAARRGHKDCAVCVVDGVIGLAWYPVIQSRLTGDCRCKGLWHAVASGRARPCKQVETGDSDLTAGTRYRRSHLLGRSLML